MPKIITMLFMLLITPTLLLASEITDAMLLKQKLEKYSEIDANFTQIVSSDQGQILNKSTGNLIILRPGKFRWQVETPEQELIVSNGQTMWLYSPFIEQVSIINLSDAIEGTPFVLLSGANEQQWSNYTVINNNNVFTVKNIDTQVQANTFMFEFSESGSISKFTVVEAQGQRSAFTLTHNLPSVEITANIFDFNIPEGVEIDDQR